jgi:hypothetical protein
MVTVYTLTPANAAQALQDNGLDALGVTALRLAASWAGADPGFDPATLLLSIAGGARTPWRGILEHLDNCVAFRGVDGAGITGAGAALRLHPQAAARLQALAQFRYGVGVQPQVRSLPVALLVRGLTTPTSPVLLDAGEVFPPGGTLTLSFHDARGLIICPIAVAAMLDDLMTALPALDVSNGAARINPGSVRSIAGLATGIMAQVCTLHGRPYTAIPGGPSVQRLDTASAPQGAIGANGLATMLATDMLAGSGATAAARLRLGWAAGGVMTATPLELPPLPGGITLPRQFVRAFAVDLDWHLRGNRSAAAIGSVPADDRAMPDDIKPQVRDGETIDYLATGPDTLAAASQVMARLAGAGALAFAVSPTFETGVGTAASPGATAHWPAFPAPDTVAGWSVLNGNPQGMSASFSGANDVVVTIPAGFAPNGASIRIFPRRFQLIDAIGEVPSFLRGDGGAAIASAGNSVVVLLRNPFGLAAGDPLPNPATLVFDLVVTPRLGNRRLWAAQTLPIAAGPVAAPADPYAASDPLAALPANVRSICPVPLFGLPRTVVPPAGPAPANPVDLALALLSESQPRQGPRLPTMARFETIVVTGITDATVSAGLAWDAVLTGGRWAQESRSRDHANANPGGPAGPDTQAPGVRFTGALAYDAARLAVKRAQPLLPLPGPSTPGWIPFTGGDNFNPPQPAAALTGTSAGVLLQTVAAVTETPELSLLPDGNSLDSQTPITFNKMLTALGNALGLGGPPNITVANADRLSNEVRREYFLAKKGNRDALWSLTRAIAEADELVYVETAGLARTARPGGVPQAHEIDLVQRLADRMTASPNLRVILCVPRETDFAPAFGPFMRRAISQRSEAVDMLRSVDAARVTVFHPRGFAGRWAQLRTTNVIIDDVWCLSGATHLRRRGLTFDGSAALASLDRSIDNGYSRKVRLFRRDLMAAKLGISAADSSGLPTPEWLRLQTPAAAFDLVADLVAQGGLGRLGPLWLGPSDATVIPQSDDAADPDGSNGANLLSTLAGLLSETPS